jgi:hypothetical protein
MPSKGSVLLPSRLCYTYEWCFHVCEDITVQQNDKIEGVKSTRLNSSRNVKQKYNTQCFTQQALLVKIYLLRMMLSAL